MFRCATPAGSHEARGVRIVDHDQCIEFVGEIADFPQRRDAAVHGEHAVGGDEARAAVLRVFREMAGDNEGKDLPKPDAIASA